MLASSARHALTAAALAVLALAPALALRSPDATRRFEDRVTYGPHQGLAVQAAAPDTLPAGARAGWDQFVGEQNGRSWSGWFDRRSGLPTLVFGQGIPWVAGRGNTLGTAATAERLEQLARAFVEAHPLLLGRWGAQLQFDAEASGALGGDVWQVAFRQVVNGVPVEGARLSFQVAHGNLVSFGAENWSGVRRGTEATVPVAEARAALEAYLGPGVVDARDVLPPALVLLPADPRARKELAWDGAVGEGYRHVLAWRFVLAVPGEAPTWVGEVSADDGAIVALYDDTRYERIKGGVFPVSNDGLCPTGCEQLDWPMPFADYSVNGGPVQYTGDHGLYTCENTGDAIASTLIGPYIRVQDNCGAVNETTTCDEPLDFKAGPGTDCAIPAGSSAGNTHSARSSFYHLNRSMEKGRAWLPDNAWLKSQVTDNVNINSTCNAYWNGSVNFYRSGGGCRNTGEIAGVFVHEWGHGIDQNDGGGYDNPSEAYADVVAFFETRESCIGRGFYMSQNCGGYGNACLNCSGIRDQDWDQRANHTPSTPAGFISTCGGGSGACGKETHCEGYLAGETVWDLAVRDLPASGMDAVSAWQHAEQLFYLSRKGSGGNIYNCSIPNSDGCGAANWFHKFRVADDDDGNLANGTPHAAAIFAAFNRHKIACGTVSDASNQNSSGCPTLARPELGVQAGSNANTLSWNAVPGAQSYNILRNDIGCDRAQIIVDRPAAPATSYVDADVANNFTVYYRIQAVGPSAACVSPVSECVSSSAQPFAGAVRFERATYGCSTDVTLRVTDGNIAGTTTTIEVWSDFETTPEVLTLNQAAPGAAKYIGSIASTSAPPVHGDGLLSIRHGDALRARYIDADDGVGGTNVERLANALGDCVYPVVSNVRDEAVTTTSATVRWATDEGSDTVLVWGATKPPANTSNGATLTTDHAVPLSGLQQCTVYWYEVRSTDPAGNLAVANDGGRYYHFETQGLFNGVMQPCHQGRLTLGKPVLACTDSVVAELVDLDLNLNPAAANSVVVTLSSNTETTPETLTLTETGPNTSTFRGTAQVAQGAPVAGDGIVQIANGDTFTATYRDGDDGTGSARVAYATSVNDCAASAVDSVTVVDIADDGATVRILSKERTTVRVDWGTTPSLGNTAVDDASSTSHNLRIGPLLECGRVHFRVHTTDPYGNSNVVDNAGQPFAFNSYIIPGVWRDGFETATGWTLEGEWQIDAPQGKGSNPPDPTAAFAGTKVLGQDLTGLGAHPGDSEPQSNDAATSPVINAAGLPNGELKIRRWFNNYTGYGTIDVRQGGAWTEVWRSGLNTNETSWGLQTIDLKGRADNNAQLQIRFRLLSGPGTLSPRSSWNIDRFVVTSKDSPDYVACGSCAGAPTFAGATGAADVDACAHNGVLVSWLAAPAWGTGAPGSYAVYRSTDPGFTPGSSNLVASGVAGTSYTDLTAPNDATLYYVVRAENAETCGNGPKNNGVVDGNTVRVSVRTTSSRVVPSALAGLAVTRINGANLRLTWNTNPDAADYSVYRSFTPFAGDFGKLGEVLPALYDDVGAGANRETYFYLVKGGNACGTEGP